MARATRPTRDKESPVLGGSPETSSAGFTLLELLIVVMIIGIVATIAIPRVSSMIGESRLNGATSEMMSALQYAESLAAQYRRPFGLKVVPSANAFAVYDSSPTGVPAVNSDNVVVNPLDKAWYVRDFDDAGAFEGTKISSPIGITCLLFYPDGHSGETDASFTITREGLQRTVKVDGTTGRITAE